jgi:hypothetical protein
MKMGTIPSPWRYDTGAYHTPEPDNMRLPAIWRCAHRRQFSDVAVVQIGSARTILKIWQCPLSEVTWKNYAPFEYFGV